MGLKRPGARLKITFSARNSKSGWASWPAIIFLVWTTVDFCPFWWIVNGVGTARSHVLKSHLRPKIRRPSELLEAWSYFPYRLQSISVHFGELVNDWLYGAQFLNPFKFAEAGNPGESRAGIERTRFPRRLHASHGGGMIDPLVL